jgi:NADH-quinone oxidoreductase subunit G
MCLVEIEGMHKLQTACNTPVREGMVVRTDSEAVRKAVREVLEFTLINHPLDCPICDQAGECGLQNYYHDYGLYNSQFTLPKVHKPKVQKIGPSLILDAERCILCTRCVRFCEEITHTNEMAIIQRGDQSEITAVKEVNNPYSTNLADICPVGALTQIDFRFKVRVWNLKTKPSICPGCARGCNVHLDHYRDAIYRIRPRANQEINQTWMCDDGRLLYKRLSATHRLKQPMIRQRDRMMAASWTDALTAARQLLGQANGAIAAQSSAKCSNEDMFALLQLLETLGAELPAPPLPGEGGWEDDNLLRRADRTPNRKGVAAFTGSRPLSELLTQARVAIIMHDDALAKPANYPNLLGSIFIGTHANATAQMASVILPVADWAEYSGSYTNFQGHTQRFTPAIPPPYGITAAWQTISYLSAALGGQLYDDVDVIFDALTKKYEAFHHTQSPRGV